MNKPAAKEPSMDEILSSIRQIIADDDAAGAPAPPPPRASIAAAPPPAPRPVMPSSAARAPEPLALSAAQIVQPTPPREPIAEVPPVADFSSMLAGLDEPAPDLSSSMEEMLAEVPELVDPEDIAFEPEPEPEPEPVVVAPPPPPVMRAPEPVWASEPPPRAAAAVSHAAPMPDPMLSSDMAEELLAPTTNAAVHGTMARLNAISAIGTGGQTIEGMMRELMRPMLKEWLDENLPALVERVVEKEIARVSRGVK